TVDHRWAVCGGARATGRDLRAGLRPSGRGAGVGGPMPRGRPRHRRGPSGGCGRMSDGGEVLGAVFRAEHGRVLARLIGLLGDVGLAEEALADAYLIAAQRWPTGGVPEHPAAWLVAAARNRAVDRIRRAGVHAGKLAALAAEMAVGGVVPGWEDVPM